MRLTILGSSSAGNGYLLDDGQQCLVIEAGMPLADTQRALQYDIQRIVALLITHEHSDHAHYVQQYLAARIPTYCSEGTAQALHIAQQPCVHTAKGKFVIDIGSFKIVPFAVYHDAAEPLGFLLYHRDCGTTLFATDAAFLYNTFRNLNNILIECNYRDDILDRQWVEGQIDKTHYERVISSHLSYHTCLDTLAANDITQVNNIVLLHLSDNNSNAAEFQQGIADATGKTVIVAQQGTVIEHFNKTPF